MTASAGLRLTGLTTGVLPRPMSASQRAAYRQAFMHTCHLRTYSAGRQGIRFRLAAPSIFFVCDTSRSPRQHLTPNFSLRRLVPPTPLRQFLTDNVLCAASSARRLARGAQCVSSRVPPGGVLPILRRYFAPGFSHIPVKSLVHGLSQIPRRHCVRGVPASLGSVSCVASKTVLHGKR